MTYDVEFSNKALKQLQKLEKSVQVRIIKVFERIRIRPDAHLSKMVGDSCYKLRIGEYRALVDIDRGKIIILVLKVGHRGNIYKKK